MDDEHIKVFEEAIKQTRVPVLVLDQKWHRLFALSGKPDDVVEIEQELNELLQEQGRLNEEMKELRRNKNKLMSAVVANMEGAEEGKEADRLDANKDMMNEINESIDQKNDEIALMPERIREVNNRLMSVTMLFCYDRLRTNHAEAKEIGDWIAEVRVELKKNIIRKQNRDINSRQIYNYMHSMFGPQVMDIFDLIGDDVDITTLTAPPVKKDSQQSGGAGAGTPAARSTANVGDGSVKKTGEGGDNRKKENFS